ncbi:ttll6 [Symbiodinium natans]|uniref:Ttll6 protein n=1 Tax=Symbiodinium natans TaxID=878477 RepID=A0A812S5H9_9DINO|nr:ttll6 [Symbiodinium natans]
MASDLRFQELEARLSRVEQALSVMQRSEQANAAQGEALRWDKLQRELEDGDSISSSELLEVQAEHFGGSLFTSSGEEIRAGVATHGPCYELQHSVWDACLWIGLPVLSKWDSVMATLLLLLNIFAQVGFVLVVQIDMLEDVLTSEKLDELLLFRANIAHDARYADVGGGRSLARRVCSQDESLQLANSQTSLVTDLASYSAIGPALALLAIGCWLSTTLKEAFNVLEFFGAIHSYPLGDTTNVATAADEDALDERPLAISQLSRGRKYMLLTLVAFPRMMVACSLMVTGTRYLANTLNLSDLILNAVALAFILDLDELIESAFMPRRPRFLLDKLGTLPISRPFFPGLEHLKVGKNERMWNALQIALLIVGLILSWYLLLQPLHQTVDLALDILCSGRQDFIYAVNAATGIIEAAPTFPKEGAMRLSSQQENVLQLAKLELLAVQGLGGLYTGFVNQQGGWTTLDSDDTPTYDRIQQVILLDKSTVAIAANNLPCTDSAFSPHLVRSRLRSITNGQVDSCAALKSQDQLCAVFNLSSVRALCPQTCGCDNPLEPAAGAFATVPFGCPKRCAPLREESPKLRQAPCRDWTTRELLASEYIRRYLTGAFTYGLMTEQTWLTSKLVYEETLRRRFYDLLPGPNKTESLQRAAEYYATGGWHRDVMEGKFELGLNIPHPRGLEGCAFFASEEIVELGGGNICTPRAELDVFLSLRPQCPVTCGCHADWQECAQHAETALMHAFACIAFSRGRHREFGRWLQEVMRSMWQKLQA